MGKPTTSTKLELDISSGSREFHLYAFPKHNNKFPPYSGIGRAGTNWTTGIKGIDVDDIMMSLANDFNTNWLFWFMRKHRNIETNIVIIEPSKLTVAEKLRLHKAYPVLLALGWVKRFKNKHYLINPKVMIPLAENLAKVCEHWFLATGENLGSYINDENQTRQLAQSFANDASNTGEII